MGQFTVCVTISVRDLMDCLEPPVDAVGATLVTVTGSDDRQFSTEQLYPV